MEAFVIAIVFVTAWVMGAESRQVDPESRAESEAVSIGSGALAFIATVLEKNRPSQLLFERSGYTRLSPQSWRKDGA